MSWAGGWGRRRTEKQPNRRSSVRESKLWLTIAQFTAVAALQKRVPWYKMLMHWAITFWGNLAGSLFVVSIIAGYGGVFDSAVFKTEVQKFATTKQVTAEWHQIFLRAIGANWLVCLACFLGMSGREYVSKIVGIWWPTFAFVSLGFGM